MCIDKLGYAAVEKYYRTLAYTETFIIANKTAESVS